MACWLIILYILSRVLLLKGTWVIKVGYFDAYNNDFLLQNLTMHFIFIWKIYLISLQFMRLYLDSICRV